MCSLLNTLLILFCRHIFHKFCYFSLFPSILVIRSLSFFFAHSNLICELIKSQKKSFNTSTLLSVFLDTVLWCDPDDFIATGCLQWYFIRFFGRFRAVFSLHCVMFINTRNLEQKSPCICRVIAKTATQKWRWKS